MLLRPFRQCAVPFVSRSVQVRLHLLEMDVNLMVFGVNLAPGGQSSCFLADLADTTLHCARALPFVLNDVGAGVLLGQ